LNSNTRVAEMKAAMGAEIEQGIVKGKSREQRARSAYLAKGETVKMSHETRDSGLFNKVLTTDMRGIMTMTRSTKSVVSQATRRDLRPESRQMSRVPKLIAIL